MSRFCRSRDLVADDIEGMLFRKHLEGSEKSRTGNGKELGKDVVSEKCSLGLIHEVRALEYKAHCRTVLIWVKKSALYTSISGSEGMGHPPAPTRDITSWKRQLLTSRGQLHREREPTVRS